MGESTVKKRLKTSSNKQYNLRRWRIGERQETFFFFWKGRMKMAKEAGVIRQWRSDDLSFRSPVKGQLNTGTVVLSCQLHLTLTGGENLSIVGGNI